MSDSLWYMDAVFYEVYVRAFLDSNGDGHGDLRGLTQKLDYFKALGVDCLWLMPIYKSPLKDDGYDIADYYTILPEYGVLDDFKHLLDEAHNRGLRVITDLVLNHTSDQHPWFQDARRDRNSPYRDFYVWSDINEKYSQARIIFLDTETSNWTWDELAGQYYWHRFYSSQPDLNYDHPAVQEEMFNVMRFWLDLGVDGFRADAVPYLFEREGTNCENLPETHAFLKRLRTFMDNNYPGRILLCEANQWPEDVRHYFGEGDEFHMGFHFPVMPRIYMALRKADRTPIGEILKRTPPIPDSCQWCTFLRNHDELTLEMVTEDERRWMWKQYAPEPRMRLNLGIRRRMAPLLDNDRRVIELANALLFSLPGSPIIYYGDEIGMGDNIWLPDRNGVRTPMQWDDDRNAGFSTAEEGELYLPVIDEAPYSASFVKVNAQQSDPGSLWNFMRQLIALRKSNPIFAKGALEWVNDLPVEVAAYWRHGGEQRVLVLNNLSGSRQHLEIELPSDHQNPPVDLFSTNDEALQKPDQPGFDILDGRLRGYLDPHQFRWLKV